MLGEHFCNFVKSVTLGIGKKSQLGIFKGGSWRTVGMIPRLFPAVMLQEQYHVDMRVHQTGEMHQLLYSIQ